MSGIREIILLFTLDLKPAGLTCSNQGAITRVPSGWRNSTILSCYASPFCCCSCDFPDGKGFINLAKWGWQRSEMSTDARGHMMEVPLHRLSQRRLISPGTRTDVKLQPWEILNRLKQSGLCRQRTTRDWTLARREDYTPWMSKWCLKTQRESNYVSCKNRQSRQKKAAQQLPSQGSWGSMWYPSLAAPSNSGVNIWVREASSCVTWQRKLNMDNVCQSLRIFWLCQRDPVKGPCFLLLSSCNWGATLPGRGASGMGRCTFKGSPFLLLLPSLPLPPLPSLLSLFPHFLLFCSFSPFYLSSLPFTFSSLF